MKMMLKAVATVAIISLNSLAPGFAATNNWRHDFDSLVEKKFTAAGFKPFDGISYSFPIGDETLGIVQIYDQNLTDGHCGTKRKQRDKAVSAMANFHRRSKFTRHR